MSNKIVLFDVEGAVNVTIPKYIAERLNFKAGDEVFVNESANGVLITKQDPNLLIYQMPS